MRDTKDNSIARLAAQSNARSLSVNLPGGVAKGKGRRVAKTPPSRSPIIPGDDLLCFDVSSSATGWALVQAMQPGQSPFLHHFGVIRPPASWPSQRRIDAIVDGVKEVVDRCAGFVIRVLIEYSAGQTARHTSHAAWLVVLGQAQGAVRQELRRLGADVETASEREWTRGLPKAKRASKVRLLYPHYASWADKGKDAGLDVADALGLALWRLGVEGPR